MERENRHYEQQVYLPVSKVRTTLAIKEIGVLEDF